MPNRYFLYRLKSNNKVYRIQIQSKLPHDPTAMFRILKRCEIFDFYPERDAKGDNQHVEKDTTERNHLQPDEFVKMDKNLEYMVDEVCAKMVYATEVCTDQPTGDMGIVSRWMTAFPFSGYLLDVVKGLVFTTLFS